MADKKDISELDFNVEKALNSLNSINDKLKKLETESLTYAKNIGDNINKALQNVGNIDTKNAEKSMNKTKELSKTISDKIVLDNVRANNKIMVEENKTLQYKERVEAKKAASAENANKRQLNSAKTLADKISDYAKTYIIYQGFNQLRQDISETIDEMVKVQYKMVEIDRVLNDNSLNIDKYRDKLIQLAYDYGNSFDNVADITLRLAQAGFDAEESLALTEKTLLALNTADLNATQATEDMVAVMAQWGLMTGDAAQEAKDYGDIIDKINKVADNFPTTSEDILNALKKTSSAFNLAGASIDETIAMITAAEVASQRGGKVIGTALSNIVQQLKAEGKINIMESLGIDVYKDSSKQEFNSIIDIITQLSEKMQILKNEGKESSAEMQNLLEVFTVFRRNVGASLLGEMAGEDSTYAKALETSINSVGYSIQENEKHMQTAKAAQEQFNATLLELKTSVWDNGVEDVYRSMLLLGSDLIKNVEDLTKVFGPVPLVIGAATLALTLLSKKMKLASYDAKTGKIEVKGFIDSLGNISSNVKEINKMQNALRGISSTSKTGFKSMVTNMAAYGLKVTEATLRTLALKTATMALNLAASAAASAGVMALTTAIQEMMNKQSAAIQLQEKSKQSLEDEVKDQEDYIDSLNEMISTYDELGKKENKSPEEVEKLYELQTKIKSILREQADTIDLINGKYDDQKKKLEQISIEEQEKLVESKRKLMEQKQSAGVGYELPSVISKAFGAKDYESVLMQYGGTGLYEGSLKKTLENTDVEGAIELFTKWEESLRNIQSESLELSNTYSWVTTTLKDLTDNTKEETEATNDFYDSLAKLQIMKMFPENAIQDVDDYNEALDKINQMDFSGMDGFKEKLQDIIQNQFPEFAEQSKAVEGTLEDASSVMESSLEGLQNLSDQYAMLKNAQDEYNESGEMTISTLQGLIDNNLLQYLSLQNGQLQINAQSMLDLAEAKKVEAIEALQSAAANDLQKIAIGDVGSISATAKGAIANVGDNAETAGNQMETAAGKAAKFSVELQAVADAAAGKLGDGVDINKYKQQAQAIIDTYSNLAKNISAINIRTASYTPKKTRSSGGSSSGSSSATANQAKREAEQAAKEAAKAEEEAYKKRLSAFEDYVTEKERLEKRWVDKQKNLGQLSNKDFLYIIEQRIKRYNEYLNELSKATWMKQEDRVELEKKYKEQIEDLQVDYLDYLKDILDEQIDALEEANDKKIELIKQEAEERINALKKVESENDRIRAKEEYEKKRQEHLNDISYWEQRTGREAQEALAEAKKNLQELDNEWKQQLEDWSIDDQIQAIETERDAQIKAIQDAQEAEIASMKEIYDAKVKLFSETGQIIYEESVIQSKALYKQYKALFVDPILSDLEKIRKSNTAAPAPTTSSEPEKKYEDYTIQYGDTLTSIARKFGTTIEKILDANPYITNRNKIYSGKTLQIPKFHEGGIVGGNKEAYALLKPREVILKPEWADGINKLAKMARQVENPLSTTNTKVEVKGDLVKINANIKDKNDADYLTRKIEQTLKNKFNIKK